MSAVMTNKLLICPYCGGEWGQIISEGRGHFTRCWDCGLQLSRHWKTEEMAIKDWNDFSNRVHRHQENFENDNYQGLSESVKRELGVLGLKVISKEALTELVRNQKHGK